MAGRIFNTMSRGPRSQDALAAVAYAGFLLAAIPALGALLDAIVKRSWLGVITWSFFFFSLAAIGWSIAFKKIAVPPPENRIFTPFIELDKLRPWPRPNESMRLIESLRTHSSKVVLVVGVSGAGKTVLLRRLLPETMADAPITYLDEYSAIHYRLENLSDSLLGHKTEDQDNVKIPFPVRIVVLDQFEQFLARLKDLSPEERKMEQDWLCRHINSNLGENSRYIISIRYEWYYDLRFLGNLIEAPQQSVDVSAPSALEPTDATRRAAHALFEELLSSSREADKVLAELGKEGTFLPLETQIVGAVMERKLLGGTRLDARYLDDTLNGPEGAIHAYFRGVLDGAPDRRVAVKVLCALSVRTRFRRQENLPDILDVLFEDEAAVLEAIAYLQGQGLLAKRGPTTYELAHDYLAEFFHRESGSELEPGDRDNILFHMESGIAKMSQAVESRHERDKHRRSPFARSIIIPLYVVMMLRLLCDGIPWVRYPLGFQPTLLVASHFFDVTYLPIFVTQFAWATYVALLYERFLSHLNEGPWSRAFSRITVLNMALCVIISMFAPFLWVLSIGWGGTVVGIKLLSLSWRQDLNRAARARMLSFGATTTLVMFFLSILGGIGARVGIAFVNKPSLVHYSIDISLLFAVILTTACFALSPLHVQRAGVSQLLGLLARARSDIVVRPSM